jgi:hypothetical protein
MPPFRAEHVGSLLRPRAVLQARAERAAGRISDDALRTIEDDAVRTAVRLQADAGMPIATDGEFRRDSWQWDFFSRTGGITKVEGAHAATPFRNEHGPVERAHDVYRITGKLQPDAPIFGDDFTLRRLEAPPHRRDGARGVGRAVSDESRPRRFRYTDADGKGSWITHYLGVVGAGKPGERPPTIGDLHPVAFLVEMDPDRVLRPHFHMADQFQVFVTGDGTFGRERRRMGSAT